MSENEFQVRVYVLDPVKYPPARLRWEEGREACQDRHDRYEETRQMTNNIKTAEGVIEAGPDEPGLAAAMQREENGRAAAMATTALDHEIERVVTSIPGMEPAHRERLYHALREGMAGRTLVAAPVGDVAPSQAGILPFVTSEKIDGSRLKVTDAMFERAWAEACRLELDVEGSEVRAILQAGLTGVA